MNPSSRRLAVVAAMSAAHLVNDSYAFVVAALLPLLLDKLGLTLGLAGLLFATFQGASGCLQPVFGNLVDSSRGGRWMAWLGIALSGVAAAGLGFAPGFAPLAALVLLGGIGTAMFHPISATLISQSAPAETRARWTSVYISCGNLGLPLGPLAIGVVLGTLGLGGTWVLGAPALLLAALVFLVAPQRAMTAELQAPPLGEMLRANARLLTGLVSVAWVRAVADAVVGSLLPLYVVGLGMSPTEAAQLLTAYLLAGALAGLAGGFLADRLGRDRVIFGGLVLAAPVIVALALQREAGPPLVVSAIASGGLLRGLFVVTTVRGQETLPRSMGMMSGLMMGLAFGLGGIVVAPMAAIAERTGIAPMYLICAALTLVGAFLVTRLPPLPRTARGGASAG